METKTDLLRRVAQTAYNVGFGAKKNFATFDIIENAPGVVGFLSLGLGVFALVFDDLNNKALSASMIVLGIAVLYANKFLVSREKYEKSGIKLTDMFNELKSLYFRIKTKRGNLKNEEQALKTIEKEFVSSSVCDQVLFSDWYAHYKFFWQHQIDWIDDELKFSFWRDKLPLSFLALVILMIALIVVCIVRGVA